MTYTDPDTVRAILAPGGSSGPGSAASMSDDDIQQAIDEVTSEIDGTLAIRYGAPFDPVPALVATIARDGAAYLATLTYRQGDPLPPGHPLLLRYARSSGLLSNIAKGIISLDVAPDPPTPIDEGTETVINPNDDSVFFTEADLGLGTGRARLSPFERWVG